MSSLLLGGSAVYLPQQSPRSFQPPQYSPHPQTAFVMQPQPLLRTGLSTKLSIVRVFIPASDSSSLRVLS